MRKRIASLCVLISLCLSSAAFALSKPEKIASVEGITEYSCENGLRLLLFPDTSKPTVTVNVTYFVGSRHEGKGETGMAHLLEHLMFKGTPDHPKIWKDLQEHGASFNGTTYYDRTNYYETLPTADASNLEFALRMEADRMVNSFIQKSDLDTEMSVVRNEFEMGENSPTGILVERMLSAAYLWHPYGNSVIGSRSDIERVPIENLKAFYKRYYRPDNAMLVIAGNFEEQKALDLVEKYFLPIPRGQETLKDTYTIEPTQDGARRVELRRVGDVAAAGATYHVCAGSHSDTPALDVLARILTDQPSGRLYQALVKPGLAASVSGSAMSLRERGTMIFFASVRTDQPVDAVAEQMQQMVESVGSSEITDEETNRAKTRILKNIELSMKDSGGIGVELSEWAAMGDWRIYFLYRDGVEKVTKEDVKRVAKHYLKPSNRTSGVYYPTKEPERATIPETPDVPGLVKGYKGRAEISKGEAFHPSPKTVEARVRRSTLPSGIKLALLPKETRGDAVHAKFTFHYGSESDLKGKIWSTQFFSSMPMRGCKSMSYQQIRDELDRLKARVYMSQGGMMGMGESGALNVHIETDRAHFGPVVALVGEILKSPVFPADEFEVVRKQSLAGMESQLSEPQALGFFDLFRKLNPWPQDNIRYIPTLLEMIEKVKAVQVEEVRKDYAALLGASFAEMSVVGDFAPEEFAKTAEKVFGSWKSPKPFRRVDSPQPPEVAASESSIQTPDKQMAIVAAGMNLAVRDDDPDYPALEFANYFYGGSANSWLNNRLRQKEGLSYGAFSMLRVGSIDRSGTFFAGAILAPQNASKGMDSLLDETRRWTTEPIPADELEDAKEGFAEQTETQWAEDASIVAFLNEALYLDRTLDFQADLYKKISELTPEQISAAVKKHIKLDRLVKVKAGDFQKKAE